MKGTVMDLFHIHYIQGEKKSMDYKNITGVIPTVMSAGLVKHNIDEILRKKKKKSLVGLGVDNIVGVNLIKATAGSL